MWLSVSRYIKGVGLCTLTKYRIGCYSAFGFLMCKVAWRLWLSSMPLPITLSMNESSSPARLRVLSNGSRPRLRK